ncbi:MAG: TIGR00730 family Rossman fold protein [Candidatus Omnitrophica bacterium]|nr:TIGR00730 family Rossman fold protein [Candidatus Omnitrophota bacterium]
MAERRPLHKNLDAIEKDLLGILRGEHDGSPEQRIYQDLLWSLEKIREARFDIVELRLLNTAFKELRHAFRIFKEYYKVPKAAVFGSARTSPRHPDYRMAKAFGRELARKGWMVITGGASGIMEAAMVGAGARSSFGLNIALPFEQSANPVIRDNKKLMNFKYFFTRKLMFLKESAATVLFPGGFGTFDEWFESLTLVQTGKAKPRPIVLVDHPKSRYWKSILETLKSTMEDGGQISVGDLELVRHTQDVGTAVGELTGFYSNYHSSRFLRDRYLIRLRRRLSAPELKRLHGRFGDILKEGTFERMKDFSEDDDKDPSLERLVFRFDREKYQRLHALIEVLNGRETA